MKMKMLFLSLLTSLAALATSAQDYKLLTPTWPNATKIVVLKDAKGQGAGCPIGDSQNTFIILTAKHVAEHAPFEILDSVTKRVLGHATVVWTHPKRDLAFLRSDVPLSAIPVSHEAPSVGDTLYTFSPIPIPEDKTAEIVGWEPGFWPSTIVGALKGLLATWSGVGPGASGSCDLNSKGEVVSIHVAGIGWLASSGMPKQVSLSEPVWVVE